MQNIKYYTKSEIKNPVMIACWAGMGNVGLGAADYIRAKLGAKLLAEVGIGDLISPEFITVEKGLSSMQSAPSISVYYKKSPPILIALGQEQFYGRPGIATMERLLDVAAKYNVKKVFTCAAFPTYMNYKTSPSVYAAANSAPVLKWLKDKMGIPPMEDGHISGLNGLLLEASKKKKIDTVCLLATLPMYAISFPNPRASKALIKILRELIGFQLDMTDLDLSIQELDRTLEKVEEQLKSLGIEEGTKDTHPAQKKSDELPKVILDKIEKLFEEAKKDKKAAHRLKQELDRWDLFKVYEDRFLDLFRENQ
ncbi:MAG: PAC2 family protein [Candidatus Omnitrophota bacterium]